MFVDANLAGDKSTRSSQKGVLIFINKAPIHWYIKIQATVEASNFGAELCAIKAGVKMVKSLCYKLRIFGVPIDGSAIVLFDIESIYKNTITLESVINRKHQYIAYRRCRESVAAKNIRVYNQVTEQNLSYMFTKIITASRR